MGLNKNIPSKGNEWYKRDKNHEIWIPQHVAMQSRQNKFTEQQYTGAAFQYTDANLQENAI